MPRIKPTEALDVIGSLDKNPEKNIEFIRESQMLTTIFPTNTDMTDDKIEIIAIRNDKERKCMGILHDDLRKSAARTAYINDLRIGELHKASSHLRHRFITVNNFLKDTDDKRQAALMSIQQERKVHNILKSTIHENKKKIEELTEFRNRLKHTVDELEPYESVITEAVENFDVWTSVKDCMDRCDALMLAQNEIVAVNKRKSADIELLRRKMIKLTSEASLAVLGFCTKLAEVDRGYLEARNACQEWEGTLRTVKNTIVAKMLATETLIDNVMNMYRILCKRRGLVPRLRKIDFDKIMFFIRDEFDILRNVLDKCSEKEIVKKGKKTNV